MGGHLSDWSTALSIIVSSMAILLGLIRVAKKLIAVSEALKTATGLASVVQANVDATDRNTKQLQALQAEVVTKTMELTERVTRLEGPQWPSQPA